jgi:hypothetical protein
VTNALIDDQMLGAVLRGKRPKILASKEIYTTGYWYVRLCQATLGAQDRIGALSRPFAELPDLLRQRALAAVLELPEEIGVLSLRELGPTIADLRSRHPLNILSIEALAAATRLGAQVHLSAPSPNLELALRSSNLKVNVHAAATRHR